MNDQNQFELNRKLYAAAATCDYGEAERLLQLGADPLGSADECAPDDHILGALSCDASDDEKLAAALPQMLKLFDACGMDIESRKIPADDGDNINLPRDLSFCQEENGHARSALSVHHRRERLHMRLRFASGCRRAQS